MGPSRFYMHLLHERQKTAIADSDDFKRDIIFTKEDTKEEVLKTAVLKQN